MKQRIKNALVPLLASRPISAVAIRLLGQSIPIFMLHRIIPDDSSTQGHTPAYIRRCLQYLKDNGHSFVSLETIIYALQCDIALPDKPVAFTIDDGFYDQASLAAPVFLEFDCPVTIFLVTGFMDNKLWPWFAQVEFLIHRSKADAIELNILDESLTINIKPGRSLAVKTIQEKIKLVDGESIPYILDQLAHSTNVDIPATPPLEFSSLTWDTARELEAKGISFGPHTVSHPILSRLKDQNSEHEIIASWNRLQDELAAPCPVFCYPNGRPCDYGSREIDYIKQAGLIGAVATVSKQVELNADSASYEFNLPRLGLPYSFQDFIQYSTWIEHAKNLR